MTKLFKDLQPEDMPLQIDFRFKEVARNIVTSLLINNEQYKSMLESALNESLTSEHLYKSMRKHCYQIIDEETQKYFFSERIRLQIRDKIGLLFSDALKDQLELK